MADNEDFFFLDFSLVQLMIQPMKMLMRIFEVYQQPEVHVVTEVCIDRNQFQSFPHFYLIINEMVRKQKYN